MESHVSNLVSSSSQNLYALRVLKAHGLHQTELSNVCRATLLSRVTYASPAWAGFLTQAQKDRIGSVVKKATRWGVYSKLAPTFEDIVNKADSILFKSVLDNPSHILHSLLPTQKPQHHNLRPRAHNRVLPVKTTLNSGNFIYRMLYS